MIMPGDKTDRLHPHFSTTSSNSQVSVLELKRLLFDIVDTRAEVNVRFRLIGEMWQISHNRIVTITDPAVILENEFDSRSFVVPDIGAVMQFELDRGFRQYQPHFHYSVIPG
jgi:hypothetical protein